MSCSPITISEGETGSLVSGTFSTFLNLYSEQNETVWKGCVPIVITGDFVYLVFALLSIGVVLTIIRFIKNKETSSNNLLFATLVETILTVGSLACYLFFFKKFSENQIINYNMNFSALIVSLVFAALSFLISIACQFIRKNDLFEK